MINSISKFAIVGLALLGVSAGVAAQDVDYRAIEEKQLASGKRTIEADKAYIFIRSKQVRTQGLFIKTPDAGELSEYEAEWREKFAKAQKRYPGRLRRYEEDIKIWNRRRRGNKPERPVEPTEENFSIGALETRMLMSFGPQFVFNKGKDENEEKFFTYLQEVEPGEYTYYGAIFYIPNSSVAGTCMCMGSVKFEARAGEIVNLGDFLQMGWVSDEAANMTSVVADELAGRTPQPIDYTLPSSLEEITHAPVELSAAGKQNNFFGIMIGRMPPIEGVLGYDRDTVIDLRELARIEAETAQAAEEAAAAAAAQAAAEQAAQEAVEAVGAGETVEDAAEEAVEAVTE